MHYLWFEYQWDIWGPDNINLGLHSRTQTDVIYTSDKKQARNINSCNTSCTINYIQHTHTLTATEKYSVLALFQIVSG